MQIKKQRSATASNITKQQVIHTSAPAKLMLLGEYAVLENYPALVAAVNKRLYVHLKPRRDRQIHIDSALAQHQTHCDAFTPYPQLDIVCSLIQSRLAQLQHGFELHIESDFHAQLGLGSSAAVCAAMGAALHRYCTSLPADAKALWPWLYPLAGTSGADLAASLWGGLISYQRLPCEIKKITHDLPLCVIYSGSKQTTPNMVSAMQHKKQHHLHYQQLINGMGTLSAQGIAALKINDLTSFIQCMHQSQDNMQQLDLSTPALDHAANILNSFSNIQAVKISGSGGGDCIVGIGTLEAEQKAYCQQALTTIPDACLLDISICPQGVSYHDN